MDSQALLNHSSQYCCVTWEDLDVFENEVRDLWEGPGIPRDEKQYFKHHFDPLIGPTIYTVTEKHIKREGKSRCWASEKHPDGMGKCTVFITHGWAEGVFEFCSKVRRMRIYYSFCSKVQDPCSKKQDCLYICFLSNPQPYIPNELFPGNDLKQTPFHQALQSAQYVLAIPNQAASIYMRLWCVFEIHTAIQQIESEKRNIKIDLPWLVSPFDVVISMLLTGFCMIAGMRIGWLFLADRFADLLGPLMWLLWAFLFFNLTRHAFVALSQKIAQWMEQCFSQHSFFCLTPPKWELLLFNAMSFLTGIAFGMSQWHLIGVRVHKETGARFEDGENLSCCIVAFFIFLSVWQTVLQMVTSYHIQLSAYDLNSGTVAEAECRDDEDYDNIWKLITKENDNNKDKAVKKIDESIEILKKLGRYDQTVVKNLERGLPDFLIRDGWSPIKICVACSFWECWWLTDLACHDGHLTAFLVFAISVLVVCFVAFSTGGHSIFFIESSLWIGFTFLICSNHHVFFTPKAVEDCMMTMSSAWLFQLLEMVVLIIVNLLFYNDMIPRKGVDDTVEEGSDITLSDSEEVDGYCVYTHTTCAQG